MSQTTDYVLGHSDFEIERLQIQSAVLANITSLLIRECNIQAGMRVLDIGCGAGDVSMLFAQAVGPSGLVVAIDREARAVETARSRAKAAGKPLAACVGTATGELSGGVTVRHVFTANVEKFPTPEALQYGRW